MKNKKDFYYSPLTENYLVEYRGDFKAEIDKIDYAVGDIITEGLGVIAVKPEDKERLLKDVPAIVYMDFRMMYALQDTSPSLTDNVNDIKINPYLDLDGENVTVGIIDSGIDYLKNEFMREDGTSRILKIWDQNIEDSDDSDVYIGKVYNNDDINRAINAAKNNQDPYSIVPSKDYRNHGTKAAGIIGGKGKNFDFQGIAENCNFIVVNLFECTSFKLYLSRNGITNKAVYNVSEIAAAFEFLKKEFFKLNNKAMVIYLGAGATEGSHDGKNLISRYTDTLGTIRGICLVTGTGNEGDKNGHKSGYLKSRGDIAVNEIDVPREMDNLSINIWVERPNKASVNVVSPTGEESKVIDAKINKVVDNKFIFTETEMKVSYKTPDAFTGNEVIQIEFRGIKPGIWKINLVGDYIIDGRYDIWLPPYDLIPEGLKFLGSDSNNTVMLPSTGKNVISVSYYGDGKALIAASGKGEIKSNLITESKQVPDISALGSNIISEDINNKVTTMSGSSAASAIVAGVCALLLQWGIIKGNDITMYSRKIRSYLIYGADRGDKNKFPNNNLGYGTLNLLGTFDIFAKIYDTSSGTRCIKERVLDESKEFLEYKIKNSIYLRIPKKDAGGIIWARIL